MKVKLTIRQQELVELVGGLDHGREHETDHVQGCH